MKKNTTQQPTVQALHRTHTSTSLLVRSLPLATLIGFLSLTMCPTTQAADFSGSLKGITITDAAGTNKPPTAVFTYKQEGETFTFDASGSSDTDGTLTKYKWDFGGGITSEGPTASYTLTDPAAKLQVTLTVVDNNNGAALSQQTITPASKGIADDFSTDSIGDYTILAGGLKIYDGTAHSSGARTTTYAIHNKELPSSDHVVEADVYTDGANGTGGLLFRADKIKKTAYLASFANGNIVLSSYSAGTKKWLGGFNGKYTAGIYNLRAEISGNTIKLFVKDILALQANNSTYSTGSSVGLYIEPYGKNTLVTLDNLVGE